MFFLYKSHKERRQKRWDGAKPPLIDSLLPSVLAGTAQDLSRALFLVASLLVALEGRLAWFSFQPPLYGLGALLEHITVVPNMTWHSSEDDGASAGSPLPFLRRMAPGDQPLRTCRARSDRRVGRRKRRGPNERSVVFPKREGKKTDPAGPVGTEQIATSSVLAPRSDARSP